MLPAVGRVGRFSALARGNRGFTAFTMLGDNSGFVVDPINDVVLVRDAANRLNDFTGSIAEAIAAEILIHTSAPVKYFSNSAGVLVPGTGLRSRHTAGGVSEGIVLEPARVNKVTARKHNPVDLTGVTKTGNASAVLSLVSDSAAIATAGLASVCTNGNAYRIDNTLGGTGNGFLVFTATTGNTNLHTASAYVRAVGQDAYIRNSSALGTVVPAGNTYARGSYTFTPVSSLDQVWIRAPLGGIAYVILPQLEEGAYVTSVIAGDATGEATRGLDDLTVNLARVPFSQVAGTVIEHASPPHDTSSNGARYWSIDDGSADNRIHTKAGTAGSKQRSASIVTATTEQLSVTPQTNDVAVDYKAALAWAGNDAQLVVNGQSRGSVDASVTLPTVTAFRIGGDAAHSDASYPAAPLRLLAHMPSRLSQAELFSRTS